MITERLAPDSAAPEPNSGTVRVPAMASVPDAVGSSAKTSLPQTAVVPVTCS